MINYVLMIFMCCGYVVYLMLIDVQSLNAIVECHCVITCDVPGGCEAGT